MEPINTGERRRTRSSHGQEPRDDDHGERHLIAEVGAEASSEPQHEQIAPPGRLTTHRPGHSQPLVQDQRNEEEGFEVNTEVEQGCALEVGGAERQQNAAERGRAVGLPLASAVPMKEAHRSPHDEEAPAQRADLVREDRAAHEREGQRLHVTGHEAAPLVRVEGQAGIGDVHVAEQTERDEPLVELLSVEEDVAHGGHEEESRDGEDGEGEQERSQHAGSLRSTGLPRERRPAMCAASAVIATLGPCKEPASTGRRRSSSVRDRAPRALRGAAARRARHPRLGDPARRLRRLLLRRQGGDRLQPGRHRRAPGRRGLQPRLLAPP